MWGSPRASQTARSGHGTTWQDMSAGPTRCGALSRGTWKAQVPFRERMHAMLLHQQAPDFLTIDDSV
jgi:hypothetical protein